VRLLNSGRIEQSQEHAAEKNETKAEQSRYPVPPDNAHGIRIGNGSTCLSVALMLAVLGAAQGGG
jgi:hypothetical protein